MRLIRRSKLFLLDEILGKIARIESTVNFLYDNFELSGQELSIFELQNDIFLYNVAKEITWRLKK